MRLNGINGQPAAGPAAPEGRQTGTSTNATPAAPSTDAAPPNVDPEFWGVLSARERQVVARLGGLGPLTYGYILNARNSGFPEMRGGLVNLKA